MSAAAVIVAAGRGRRMGFDKLLASLGGKSVLQWSLDAFRQAPSIERIVLVTTAERFATLDLGSEKEVLRVDGDRERFLSVVRGLDALSPAPTYVAVHDGARPLVRPDQIEQCIRTARDSGAAALARRVTETLKKASRDGYTRSSVPREDLWIMETPQVFRFKMLRRAYAVTEARRMQVTDDVSAAEAIGVPTRILENPDPNPKITVPQDLAVAEALLKAQAGSARD